MDDLIIINSRNQTSRERTHLSVDGKWLVIIGADGEHIGSINTRGLKDKGKDNA